MELVDVFRVETQDRKGPYMGGYVSLSHGESVTEWENHPAPYSDPIATLGPPSLEDLEKYEWHGYERFGRFPMLDIHEGEHCGFHSLRQMLTWFDIEDNLRTLDKAGHGLSHYRVRADEVRYGEFQVVFKRDSNTTRRIKHMKFPEALAGV